MIVTHKIKLDLVKWELPTVIDVMQDDKYSRNLEITLLENGNVFTPPASCTAMVRYRKADRIGGAYDTLPDGTPAGWISENVLTVALAPQVCTTPGTVDLVVTLLSEAAELTSFVLQLSVHKLPTGVKPSREYIKITGFIPQTRGAKTGQYLKVKEVDQQGRVTSVETAPVSEDANTLYIPQPDNAKVGHHLKVKAVDQLGRVTALESEGPSTDAETLAGLTEDAFLKKQECSAVTALYTQTEVYSTGNVLIPVTVLNNSGSLFSQGKEGIICNKDGYILICAYVFIGGTSSGAQWSFGARINGANVVNHVLTNPSTNGQCGVTPVVVAPVSAGDIVTLYVDLGSNNAWVFPSNHKRTGLTLVYVG